MLRYMLVVGLVLLFTLQLEAEPTRFTCDTPEATLIEAGVPRVASGSTAIYIGYQQISGANQDPIIARFDSGIRTWCRTDYETSRVSHQGYLLAWDGGNRLYAVFSTEGSQAFNQDFSRFTVDGWLEEYGPGNARAAVIARIDPVTGDITNATYHSAVLTNGNTNSLTVTDIQVLASGNVVVRADADSFPREVNGSRMVCTGRPYRYTVEFNADLTVALGAVSTGCSSVSPLPSTARVPPQVTKITPTTGDFFEDQNQVTFQWLPAEHAVWYRIYIVDSNGFVINNWRRSDEVCIGDICLLQLVLRDGRHDWYITGWGADGQGPWTSATTFFVGRRPPGQIQRLGPVGTVTSPATPLEWLALPDAEWYRLYLVGRNNYVIDRWFQRQDICAEERCTLPMTELFLINGSYIWWLQPWGEGGLGEWTPTGLEFTLEAPPPEPIVPLLPSEGSMTMESSLNFQWRADPGATWYRLYISETSGRMRVFDRWYDSAEICSGAVCGVPAALDEGDYRWFVRPWGPGGFGTWNNGVNFSVTGGNSEEALTGT